MSQITTHILDTAKGQPATGVPLTLSRMNGDHRETLADGVTDIDGRVADLLGDTTLDAGTYCMRFDTGTYFVSLGEAAFYPWIEVVFNLPGSGEHYHIPLLLAPYGYSTYRGS